MSIEVKPRPCIQVDGRLDRSLLRLALVRSAVTARILYAVAGGV
jgi:hypothetical protein